MVETIKTTERVFDGMLVKVDLHQVELPDGTAARREIVKHPGAVAIVAFDEHDNVLMIRQFRLGAGDTLQDSVTVRSAGGTERSVVVTVTGVNDAASVGGTTSLSVTEDEQTYVDFASGERFVTAGAAATRSAGSSAGGASEATGGAATHAQEALALDPTQATAQQVLAILQQNGLG